MAIELSHDQRDAVALGMNMQERIVSVTGGAGTGKTTTMKQLYDELIAAGKTVALCAPTGRAAKRISEATGVPASTIHKLLEFPKPGDKNLELKGRRIAYHEPRRGPFFPLSQDVLLIDECSMIGVQLFDQIMGALKSNGSVRLFGDINQLPPVEQQSVIKQVAPFKDMLKRYPSVVLRYNFRSEDSIVSNSLRILSSRLPVRNAGFEIIYTNFPFQTLLEYVTEHKEYTTAAHQILIPTRKGDLGTLTVNPSIQLMYRPNGPALRLVRYDDEETPLRIRAGDKFIWIKNDYTLDMYNGETGYVEGINTEDGSINLVTPDRALLCHAEEVMFRPGSDTPQPYDPRKAIDLGYSITTHKAQGSEFDTVIYCITGHQPFMLNRQNFYTAITRAKKKVILITDRKGIATSMRTYITD